MTREQAARREAVSRLGQAVGEGIAEGLRVSIVSNAETNPVVGISAVFWATAAMVGAGSRMAFRLRADRRT
jgi:hypothetical protein